MPDTVAQLAPGMQAGPWEGLRPPYSTIVADPPWQMAHSGPPLDRSKRTRRGKPVTMTGTPYSTMSDREIGEMPVADLAADDAHLYLWVVSSHMEHAYGICRAWGFRPSQTLVWAKHPFGFAPGGTFASVCEFLIFARRGHLAALSRPDRSWWSWPRGPHSVKPPAFYDLVERVSPGPYLELFARQPRLGWDSWGWGYEDAR